MKVLWTKFALDSLSEVYYYYLKNVNLNIACNIRDSILSITKQLEKHSLSGPTEELLIDLEEGHRYIVRGNYKIIYKIQNEKVYITDVFDTRQNPDKIRRNK
ncbi:MAG TPA: type II toxin-antitoxin system RelE/ParE family toxin [Prolixibacteraceae bacterium]|jgi:plasmid stabilization system protein ParE